MHNWSRKSDRTDSLKTVEPCLSPGKYNRPEMIWYQYITHCTWTLYDMSFPRTVWLWNYHGGMIIIDILYFTAHIWYTKAKYNQSVESINTTNIALSRNNALCTWTLYDMSFPRTVWLWNYHGSYTHYTQHKLCVLINWWRYQLPILNPEPD
jgi:hypothetical protein